MIKTILIFLLWITQGYTECPSSCNCTLTSVICINKDLEMVPLLDSLETSPVILDFSGNKLVFIGEEDFSFPKSDEVKEVYLNNSEIADIGFATFDELENLQELYLGQNYLNTISEFVIEELDSMILLDLSSNYFNGDMPVIRSKSLEVLVVANSKISNIAHNALKHLPNLKLLLLQENNIQTLTYNVFENYVSNSFFVRLSFNSWICNCENIRTFEFLDNRNFIDSSEPYQCIFEGNEMINIFDTNSGIETMTQRCNKIDMNKLQASFEGYHEVRAMVDEERQGVTISRSKEDNLTTEVNDADMEYSDYYEEQELDIKEMNDKDLEAALPGGCWNIFANTYSKDNFFMAILIATASSFFVGCIVGIIFCKILYSFKYKKFEQSSDSQVQLLQP